MTGAKAPVLAMHPSVSRSYVAINTVGIWPVDWVRRPQGQAVAVIGSPDALSGIVVPSLIGEAVERLD